VLGHTHFTQASAVLPTGRISQLSQERDVRSDIDEERGMFCSTSTATRPRVTMRPHGESVVHWSQSKQMTSGNSQSGETADLSATQLAERVAIRSLVDAYAYCADRRDATGQMALFTEDTDFLVYMDSLSLVRRRANISGGGPLWPRCSTNSTPMDQPCISTDKTPWDWTATTPPAGVLRGLPRQGRS
jgi:SnoaL-like domain